MAVLYQVLKDYWYSVHLEVMAVLYQSVWLLIRSICLIMRRSWGVLVDFICCFVEGVVLWKVLFGVSVSGSVLVKHYCQAHVGRAVAHLLLVSLFLAFPWHHQ